MDTQDGIVTDIFPICLGLNTAVAVHSYDCDNVWLLDYSDLKNVIVYSITNNGIIQYRKTILNSDDYTTTFNNSDPYWSFNLSMDCRDYTFSATNNATTYYGSFDRSDASFLRKSSHTFSDYTYICNSLISPDKSRIYYLLFRGNEWAVDLAEVKIIDGLPDYDTFRIFHHFEKECCDEGLFYGPDGKVYFMGYHSGQYGTIEIENNKAVYKDFVSYPTYWAHTHHTMPSWFLPNPCGASPVPCADMKPPVIRWRTH